jgi:hypothetical protein
VNHDAASGCTNTAVDEATEPPHPFEIPSDLVRSHDDPAWDDGEQSEQRGQLCCEGGNGELHVDDVWRPVCEPPWSL